MGEKRLISLNWIVGYLAMWAVRAKPDGWPCELKALVAWFSEEWDRTASVWMTRADLVAHTAPIAEHAIVKRWARPADPDAGDPGFDGLKLAALIVESTWANGALNDHLAGGGPGEPIAEHAAPRVKVGERVKSRDGAAANMRARVINDARWWGAFMSALSGTAGICPMTEDAETRFGPSPIVKRAAAIADVATSAMQTMGLVPPTVAADLEPLAAVLHTSEPAAQPIINMNFTSEGEDHGVIAGRVMSDLARMFSRYAEPSKPRDVFNPNTGKFETKGNTGAADFAEQQRVARSKGYAPKLENELCSLLSPHVGEVPEEQVNGAGAVEVLERILKGHRERLEADRAKLDSNEANG